jgi:1-aminocyclopropane-1-carboxylate deaminase
MFEFKKPSLHKIRNDSTEMMGIELYMLRDDLNHPYIQGNKARKLKYNLIEAKKQGKHKLLTFGGAWSNHIYSTAYASKLFEFQSVGIIRGEKPQSMSHTLQFAQNHGMKLHFVSRDEYRSYISGLYFEKLKDLFGDFYLIPEGGSNHLGVKGCAEIVADIPIEFTHLCCAAGTAATAAGILSSLRDDKKLMIFPALKNGEFLKNEILKFFPIANLNHCEFIYDYYFGGYAKYNAELVDFIKMMNIKYQLPLDQVYTAKMMFGIFDLIQKGYFLKGDVVIAYHSGGLQGLKGLAFRHKVS